MVNLGDPAVFSPAGNFKTVGDLVNVLIKNATVLAGLIVFVLLIFGGFTIIVGAGGDPKKLEQGKQAMVGAIGGLILIVAAIWIIQIIEKVTGLPILNPN